MRLGAWLNGKIAVLSGKVKKTASFVATVIHVVFAIPTVRKKTYDFLLQAMEGFGSLFKKRLIKEIGASKKTQAILVESAKENLIPLGYLLLIQGVSDSSFYLLSDQHNPTARSVRFYVSTLISIGFSILWIQRFLRNTTYNMALAKLVADEQARKKPHDPSNQQHYQPCGCDNGALIWAGMTSALYFTGNTLFLWATSYIPIAKYAAWAGGPLLIGYGLAEHQLAGKCREHRDEELRKQNAYAYGMGVACVALEFVANKLLESTGIEIGYFAMDHISNAIYPYFIVTTNIRGKKMPGQEPGFDIFDFSRTKIKEGIHGAVSRLTLKKKSVKPAVVVMPKVAGPMEQKSWVNLEARSLAHKGIDWKKWLKRLEDQEWMQFIRNVVLYDLNDDWRTLEKFETSKSIRLFFDAYYTGIMWSLKNIEEMRRPTSQRSLTIAELPMALLAPRIPALPKKLVSFMMTPEYLSLIKIIFDKSLAQPLAETIKFLEEVKEKQDKLNKKEAEEGAQTKAGVEDILETLLPAKPQQSHPVMQGPMAMNPAIKLILTYSGESAPVAERKEPDASPFISQPAPPLQSADTVTVRGSSLDSNLEEDKKTHQNATGPRFTFFANLSEAERGGERVKEGREEQVVKLKPPSLPMKALLESCLTPPPRPKGRAMVKQGGANPAQSFYPT